MPALVKNYTVIAFDLPGLGNSAPSTIGYTDADIATVLHLRRYKVTHHGTEAKRPA